ncbi:MAG: hypothetical protein U0354_11075 [Candidatus Sericytochromatia bacterium]
MAKKNKQVTSRGGNSFLTVKSGEDAPAQKEVHPLLRDDDDESLIRAEEEKIEEFADNVAKFLDKIDNLKSIFKSFFEKKYIGGLENLKMMVLKGKLKFLKPALPLIIVVQKVSERWGKRGQEEFEEEIEEDKDEKDNKEPKKPLTFLELAEKNIIFTDNKKVPLYTIEMLKGKSGYVASESVIAPMVMENIINAFQEVAPKAKGIPTPESGKYANIPMAQVMEEISEIDILEFLEYVRNFPRGYVGKNYRITESFAGWAVSGTPDD